jgi:hypothetical protein
MLYFIGATCSEHRRRAGRHTGADGFLLSHDHRFVDMVMRHHGSVCALASGADRDTAEIAAFRDALYADVAPFNVAGLCDIGKRNMYEYR